MAFSSTFTITINSVAKVLSKIRQDDYASEWLLLETTGEYRMKVRHSTRVDAVTKQEYHRHNLELVYTVYKTATTTEQVRKYYTVMEFPKESDLAQAKLEYEGFRTAMNTVNTNGIFEWMS